MVKRTQTTTKTATTTRSLRRLSVREEQIIRMSKGIKAGGDQTLEAKTDRPDVLAQLRDIEANLFIQAGHLPELSAKSRIIDKLKKGT